MKALRKRNLLIFRNFKETSDLQNISDNSWLRYSIQFKQLDNSHIVIEKSPQEGKATDIINI